MLSQTFSCCGGGRFVVCVVRSMIGILPDSIKEPIAALPEKAME